MTATVEAIEQDFEGRVYLAVTVDDDPGKDLGLDCASPATASSSSRRKWNPYPVAIMMSRYRLDNKSSRFTVQAFATGLLSFAAHSPTFAGSPMSGVASMSTQTISIG